MTRRAVIPRAALAIALTRAARPAVAPFEGESVAAFICADANGDEMLILNAFRMFISTLAANGAPMSRLIRNLGVYRIAFGRVDLDDNGLASPVELRRAEAQE
jgi:hypothetical protein